MNNLLFLAKDYFNQPRSKQLDEFLRAHYQASGSELCDLAAKASVGFKTPEAVSLAKPLIYPAACEVFRAFAITPYAKVLILGQDPYHDGCACGLAFAHRQKISASLRTIIKELKNEFNFSEEASVDLDEKAFIGWAQQGVLLLNTALSVEPAKPGSHIKIWRDFTNYVISNLNCDVAMLWGEKSKQYEALLKPCTLVLKAAHPSPLARGKFYGCGHFNMANLYLKSLGKSPIKWLN